MRTSFYWHSPAIRRIAMESKSAGGTWSPTTVHSPKEQKEENFSVFFSSSKPVGDAIQAMAGIKAVPPRTKTVRESLERLGYISVE